MSDQYGIEESSGGKPPPPPPGVPGIPDPNARERIAVPAIIIIVTGALGIPLQLIGMVMNIMGVGMGATSGQEGVANIMSGGIGIVFNIIGLAVAGFLIYGGLQLKNLGNWTIGLIAAILSVIPCCACCLTGIPGGIWALIVMNKPEIKSAFAQK